MPRVIGIDPGTKSIDVCGLDDGRVFLDRSFPTAEAVHDPQVLLRLLRDAGPLDLVAGPSGYGLPLVRGSAVTEDELRLAFLAAPGEAGEGGIGGIRGLARTLARSALPLVFTPGVIHLASVPAHRKVNRIDMGTADKVGAAAVAIVDACRRTGSDPGAVSLVLVELGGAFTAVLAVREGRIVDGIGGSAGPLGFQAAGALDGEVAFLAGEIPKRMLFGGGASTVAGWGRDDGPERFESAQSPSELLALDALLDQTVKAAVAMAVSVGQPCEFVLSGRLARVPRVVTALVARLQRFGSARLLESFAAAKEAAQGAALLADGLAGGAHQALVDRLGIREAKGTVLDHLYVIPVAAARQRLGLG
jgi:predicted butyrate kinase (DUF1464 family)